ncbi:MAG: DUF2764 family protein [bacterium]|jgi:hypothetical protein|nr:DUF2764 domain-containing protein [candidate division KSB1 bacterium]MDH7561137.1 DUF2764 family protein [bacterium]
MDKHYYLVSQLPTLYFDREAYLTVETFLQEAAKWLSASEYATLAAVDINDVTIPKHCPGVLAAYKDFERRLCADLAAWRQAQRSGQDYKPATFAPSLVREGNPLEVEKRLLRLRWDFVEQHESDHHFDFEFLILYMLKLQILRRLFTFNKEKGMQLFRQLCEVQP